jgi:phosphoglycolate phosphatase-like HAD superfamily hydrolase
MARDAALTDVAARERTGSRRPHVVWDWNGTLCDDWPVVVDAMCRSLERSGHPGISAEQAERGLRRPLRAWYEGLAKRGLTDAEWDAVARAFRQAYHESAVRPALMPGCRAALERWRREGTQSLVSLWDHEDLVASVIAHGLGPLFQRVDGRSAPDQRKRDILAAHVEALGLRPVEVVVVGDTADDVQAARSLGMRPILLDAAGRGPAELTSREVTDAPVARSLHEATEMVLAI